MNRLMLSALLLLSFNALSADLAENHQALCETAEAKALKGKTGSCLIIISNLKNSEEQQGICTGKFMDVIPCTALYISMKEGSVVRVSCGADPKSPLLYQVLPADSKSYTVSAMITKDDGSTDFISNNSKNSYFESELISIAISSEADKKSGTVTLQMENGKVDLSEVKCE